MLSKGSYYGFYKYATDRIQKLVGYEKTYFFIDITEVDGDLFHGSVKDDGDTGGTPGVGTITGRLENDRITFVKQMPIASFVLSDGRRKIVNRKHPKIFYEGAFANGKFSGTWKIKFRFLLIGFLPLPIPPTIGTWEMERK